MVIIGQADFKIQHLVIITYLPRAFKITKRRSGLTLLFETVISLIVLFACDDTYLSTIYDFIFKYVSCSVAK